MGLSNILDSVKKRLKKFKEDLEKESVSQSKEKPHSCCTLPEEALYKEDKEAKKEDKVA